MIDLARKLYPIHRSITGKGVVKSLKIIKKKISKLDIRSFNSGSKVFDWIIPPEWNIQDAFIAKINGEKVYIIVELFSVDGKNRYFVKDTKSLNLAKELGSGIGELLKEKSKGSYKK